MLLLRPPPRTRARSRWLPELPIPGGRACQRTLQAPAAGGLAEKTQGAGVGRDCKHGCWAAAGSPPQPAELPAVSTAGPRARLVRGRVAVGRGLRRRAGQALPRPPSWLLADGHVVLREPGDVGAAPGECAGARRASPCPAAGTRAPGSRPAAALPTGREAEGTAARPAVAAARARAGSPRRSEAPALAWLVRSRRARPRVRPAKRPAAVGVRCRPRLPERQRRCTNGRKRGLRNAGVCLVRNGRSRAGRRSGREASRGTAARGTGERRGPEARGVRGRRGGRPRCRVWRP